MEKIAISKFKATCLAVLEKVRKTGQPVLVTRFGHAVADYAVELARRAGTRSVVLFHHRQDRTDETLDGLAQRFRGAFPHVIVAKEGAVLNP